MNKKNNAFFKKQNNHKLNVEEIKNDNHEFKLNLVKRTIENYTHEVIEDIKLKNITSWRKSEEKFFKNLIYNILSLGILHIISLFYPNLYLKLYCNPWPPKECDYFLVEDIYGELTLCTKIHKKAKHISYNSDFSKNNISSFSLLNFTNKIEKYLTKNLTYSFKYKSITYEYNEETNEIIPVYMDLSKITNKEIFNYFGEGLSSDNLTKFQERYGKNEYNINLNISELYLKKIEIKYFIFAIVIKLLDLTSGDFLTIILYLLIVLVILFIEYKFTKKIMYNLYKKEFTLDGEEKKLKVKRKYKSDNNFYREINNCDLLTGDIIYLKSNDLIPCDCLILEGEWLMKII